MKDVPRIETARLVLRGFVPSDADDVFAYASNPNVLLYTTGTTPPTVAESARFVQSLIDKPAGALALAIVIKGETKVVGAIEFGFGDGKTGSVHYALAEEHWNKGFMTEAVTAVLSWAFAGHPKLQAVTTSAVTANVGSTRVMEKCGMEFLRHEYEKWDKCPEPVELAFYSISRKRWEAGQ